jgi:hypothetical protein
MRSISPDTAKLLEQAAGGDRNAIAIAHAYGE